MSTNIDLCYITTHGFAARMVLQTNLLKRLVDKGLKVALIVPDAEDENLLRECNKANVNLVEFNIKTSFWLNQINQMRKYFLEDIEANPAIYEKYMIRVLNRKRSWMKKFQTTLGVFIYKTTKVFPFIRKVYRSFESSLFNSSSATHLIKKLNPKLIISTYPMMTPEPQLLRAAKRLKIKTVIHLLSWDNITAKGNFPVLADEYLAWGSIMKQEFKEYYGIPNDKIHTTGVPHFDLHIAVKEHPAFEKYIEELGLDASKPYLFFAMSAPRFAPREIDNVEWIAKQIMSDRFGKDMQFVVRPHPQNMKGDMADFSWLPRLERLEKYSKVAVDYPKLVKNSAMKWSMQQNDMKRLSNLLYGSSVVLNSGSTVSIDALMIGKPVILTSFDAGDNLNYWHSARRLIDYTHLKKITDLGGVRVTRDFTDLEAAIQGYLDNSDLDIESRQDTIEKECYRTDGRSTERVVERIREIIQ